MSRFNYNRVGKNKSATKTISVSNPETAVAQKTNVGDVRRTIGPYAQFFNILLDKITLSLVYSHGS